MTDVRPRHYLDLADAATLKTESFALAQRAAADCLKRNAMGAFYGPAGNGKTFALQTAMSRVSEREVIWVDCQWGMTYRAMVDKVLRAVTNGKGYQGTRLELERSLTRELRERPRVLVIDEAQLLNAEGIEILRHLHDDPESRFALLLVGGNGCWDVLSSQPMLRSRIHRVVEFKRLTPVQVSRLMPRFHPVLASCGPDLLRSIDLAFGHGSFRNWANFVVTARDLCQAAGLAGIDEAVVHAAFKQLGASPSRAAA